MKIVDVIDEQEYPRTEQVTCPLCSGRREPRQIAVSFGMIASVAECGDCRIAFQTPRPSPDATLAYMNWRWSSSDSYVANPSLQLKRALAQLESINQAVDKPTTLLDFGAGAGSFVKVALNNGWQATGVERSDSAIARAKDFYGVELAKEVGNEKYDVVTLWDVVEHLREPEHELKKIRQYMAADGLIFVETGNYESWPRLHQEDKWGLYLLDHHYYFTPNSLRKILERAGFRNFQLLDVNHKKPPSLLKFLRHPKRARRAWRAWSKAKAKWPEHGDIEIMIAVAQNSEKPL